jgi:hypothetical protein
MRGFDCVQECQADGVDAVMPPHVSRGMGVFSAEDGLDVLWIEAGVEEEGVGLGEADFGVVESADGRGRLERRWRPCSRWRSRRWGRGDEGVGCLQEGGLGPGAEAEVAEAVFRYVDVSSPVVEGEGGRAPGR